MSHFTPQQIVRELDRYIIKQTEAKKAVAIALRNRWRRQQAPDEMRDEILPNNIIMIGPTGVGKTEIARRLAKLVNAPFIKVEASNYTEVGYVGRDVESIIRDLVEIAVGMAKAGHREKVADRVEQLVEERLIDLIMPIPPPPKTDDLEAQERRERTRDKIRAKLRSGELEERRVTIKKQPPATPLVEIFSRSGVEEFGFNFPGDLNPFAPQQTKEKEMTIGEAREQLAAEETDKLLDMEMIVEEAKQLAESNGIVFVDEIDKIAGGGSQTGPDVSREGVQRDLLPIIEGSAVNTRYGPVRTDHILFIAAGAFNVAKPADLIPEFQGRFPIRVELSALDQEDFIRILKEPDNSLIKQYTALLGSENCTLEFTDKAIDEIARVASIANQRSENIGARRLHTVMSTLLEDVLYELPESRRKRIAFTAEDVSDKLDRILADEDLTRYIL
ncbi:MAG: ATP-dependent protease ATPase subunit HslU [Candidatus Latescibacteria bacterium]|nr:ATP-dependent protease ATPase subunit HslU [Candidatus Latescibacterota bacterium]NIM21344.1 ATP-dependent protease ATPase subunit HslU [Candidatus Latescibacterota bacterium]NIM65525.1 ATP-dependent protease ATPase subunit HslU [Candidatus Latescibacterota bacterium]NIO01905.1 ATP-dependent protease ATPase subunit HslU [Candidatus Latescibacterota bacterium]NIO28718.1 ATP-dependent protease ATPase subunit HslU [Candidatus Latescibacterota bacterium]